MHMKIFQLGYYCVDERVCVGGWQNLKAAPSAPNLGGNISSLEPIIYDKNSILLIKKSSNTPCIM